MNPIQLYSVCTPESTSDHSPSAKTKIELAYSEESVGLSVPVTNSIIFETDNNVLTRVIKSQLVESAASKTATTAPIIESSPELDQKLS